MVDLPHLSDDERRLAELGYKQELNRNWSGFSNFAISFSVISILAGCFTTFGQAWNNGGPVAITWGWPVISAFILLIGLSMSELVSAFPTSGGIYWWASRLGGAKAGYYTGWLNLIGLLGMVASVAYGCATFLDATLGTYSALGVRLFSRPGFCDLHWGTAAGEPAEHLQWSPHGHTQQHLGVVARVRIGSGDRRPHPPAA
jgi:amino acid transporter